MQLTGISVNSCLQVVDGVVYRARPKRPRAIVLVPTRELGEQVQTCELCVNGNVLVNTTTPHALL